MKKSKTKVHNSRARKSVPAKKTKGRNYDLGGIERIVIKNDIQVYGGY